MGYSYRNNGCIKDYWPDNTDTVIYLNAADDYDLAAIMQVIKNNWPDATPEDIRITSEYIHTECLTYDSYDSSDYTNFIVLTYRKL